MYQYHCTGCGFRVLSGSKEESVTVAKRHHEREHEETLDREIIEDRLTTVSVSETDAEDAHDDLGPVFSDERAKEW